VTCCRTTAPPRELGQTTALCPACLRALPARLVGEGDQVFLERDCPEHGFSRALIWRGPPDYETWRGRAQASACCGTADAATSTAAGTSAAATTVASLPDCPAACGACTSHPQQPCCVLIEVTSRCDLSCPVCFAAAGGSRQDDPPFGEIEQRLAYLASRAPAANVQLSGGEPTLRDDLPAIVALAADKGFGFTQLNSNGLRLAAEPEYAAALAEAGLGAVFLQFDGVTEASYVALRGRPLLDAKRRAIAVCGEVGLGVVLVPTVAAGVNLDELGAIVDFALANLPTVRGVHVQPLAHFGRYASGFRPEGERVTLPDVMRALADRPDGAITLRDFKPGDCEHAVCSFCAEYLRLPDGRLAVLRGDQANGGREAGEGSPAGCCGTSKQADGVAADDPAGASCCEPVGVAPQRKAALVARRWRAPAAPAVGAGSAPASDEWDDILRQVGDNTFSLSGMAFQDAWSLDTERLRQCYLQVLTGDDRLVPFCAYNLTDDQGRGLPGGRSAHPQTTPLDAWVAARVAGGVRPGRPLPAAVAAAPPHVDSESPRLDPEALRAHQLAALRATIDLARSRSPFYAERLAGVDARALSSLDDLAALPFTTADDLRRHAARLCCAPASEIERIVTLPTSGTAGEPKRIQFSAADQELTVDFFQHGMSVLAGPGDRVLILLPGERPGSVGELLARGLERLGATPLPYGPVRDHAAALDHLVRERTSVVVGIPVQVLALARLSVSQDKDVRLRSVLLSTDHVPRAIATAVEQAWGCRVFNHYGSTEMGLGGGVECAAHAGLHLREADLLFEVVDPLTGASLPVGSEGEIVFTTLTREAMPLIRYRTGDLGRFVAEPCPCGSALRLLATVRERRDDVAVLAGGERLSLADLDEALFALDDVGDFRAGLELGAEGADAGGGMAAARERLVIELALGDTRHGSAPERAQAALERLPAVARARAAGRLRVEVTTAVGPGSGGDGRQKRTLRDERPQETE
jgi:phenylacetate-CoA ligase